MVKTAKNDFGRFSIVNACVCDSTKTVFEIHSKLRQVHAIFKWISTYYHKYKHTFQNPETFKIFFLKINPNIHAIYFYFLFLK